VDGVKLTQCEPAEIAELTAIGNEAFLTQLLTLGFFHADPHPGNLLSVRDPALLARGYRLALLDFGLVARLGREDMDALVSSVVHLANKDWASLIDDFVALKILPADTPRVRVEPLMAKVLGPYVQGGGGLSGAMTAYGGARGVQSLTNDLLGALSAVPFSIPPYFALLARAVAVLEGIALQGEPDYRIVMASFPFVSRKLLSDDAPALQKALSEILYAPAGTPGANRELRAQRLTVLLSAALGSTAAESGAFIDFDSAPKGGVPLTGALRLLLSPQAASLRSRVLDSELLEAADVLARDALRRAARPLLAAAAAAQQPPLPFLPPPPPLRLPAPLPPPLVWASPEAILDAAAPRLSRDETLLAQSLSDAASSLLGVDLGALSLGWSPFQLRPGPLGLPLPSLAPLPAGVSSAALAAAAATAQRAAVSAHLPLADSAPARAAAQALQGALQTIPAGATASHQSDVPLDLATTLGALDEAEGAVLTAIIDKLRVQLQERFMARLETLRTTADVAR